MNKKGVEISLNVLIVVAIGLLCLVVLSIIFYVQPNILMQPFNPDKDVCTKWNCYDFANNGDLIFCNEKPIPDKTGSHQYGHLLESSDCSQWRPKNECELNPKADNCICDSYNPKYYQMGGFNWSSKIWSKKEIKGIATNWTKKLNRTFVVKDIGNDTCIQAHEKTIQDVSCQDLKINILKHYRYNPKTNSFGEFSLCSSFDCIDTDKLVDLAISKGCEI